MPFIGQNPSVGAYNILDDITIGSNTNGPFNLLLNGAAFKPESANHLLVSLNGVIQKPGSSFTVSGDQITFVTSSGTLTTSDSIDFIMALGNVLDVGTPTDGTISENKIATNAVTSNKIASNAVTMNKLATSGTLPALNGSALTGMGMTFIGLHSPSENVTTFDISLSKTAHDYYKLFGFLHNVSDSVNAYFRFLDDAGNAVTGGSDYHSSRFKIEDNVGAATTDNAHAYVEWSPTIGNDTGETGIGFEMLVGPTNSASFPIQMQGQSFQHAPGSNASVNLFGGGFVTKTGSADGFGGVRLFFSGSSSMTSQSFVYVYGLNKS